MDDYTREMMDLKTLVTRTLEKKGVLAKIRVILSLFHRILEFCAVFPFRFPHPPASADLLLVFFVLDFLEFWGSRAVGW